MKLQRTAVRANAIHEDFSEYVAHLQSHMALQARNLVPTLIRQTQHNNRDSIQELLHQTQADSEKQISRQVFRE